MLKQMQASRAEINYMENQKMYEYRDLNWDTSYFGVKSARVTLKDRINRNEWVKIRNLIGDNDFVVIDNINNNPTNNFLISHLLGVFLADINFQFTKNINTDESAKYIDDGNITVENNMGYDKQIVDISENSYNHSRFFNDPFLDKSKALNIYSHWVKSSFLNENKYFLYYHTGEEIWGYILFSMDKENKKAVIELISVKENMKNKSIGTKMMNHLERYLIENFKEIEVIKVGTQSNNTKAINFYIKNGFKVNELISVYHYWPNFMLNNMDWAVNDEVAASK